MADKVINAIILEATNTEAVWIEKNPVLRKGQLAISSDKNGKYKVGNGTSTWTQLSYAKADLASSDVTTALGFTPATSNHTHNLASTSANGYLRQLDGSTAHFLRGDGTWATPPAASVMKGATASTAGAAGLVPAPAVGKQASFLRGDGTWQSISLSTLGVTVTAAELNYMDGVTSNVQTQLNGKAATSHTHNYAGSSSAGGAANSVKTSLIIKLNGGATEGTNLFTFNGSAAKTVNITASSIGAATSSHTHTKAQITDFPTSLKNPAALTIQFNGTSQGAYDGSTAKTINITAASIGAATSSHTHSYLPLSGGTLTGQLTVAHLVKITAQGASEGGELQLLKGNDAQARDVHIDAIAHRVRFYCGDDGQDYTGFDWDYVDDMFYLNYSGLTVRDGITAADKTVTISSNRISVGSKASMWSDNEGGNLRLTNSSGTYYYEMDGVGSTYLRMYSWSVAENKLKATWAWYGADGTFQTPILTTPNATIVSLRVNSGIEMYAATPFIDFHYNNNSSVDYTSRLIADVSGELSVIRSGAGNVLNLKGTSSGECSLSFGNSDGAKMWVAGMGVASIGSQNYGWYKNGTNAGLKMQLKPGELEIRVGTVTVYPQDSANEGGEIRLNGAGSYKQICIDNNQGMFRVYAQNPYKCFVWNGDTGDFTMGYGSLTVSGGLINGTKGIIVGSAITLHENGTGIFGGLQINGSSIFAATVQMEADLKVNGLTIIRSELQNPFGWNNTSTNARYCVFVNEAGRLARYASSSRRYKNSISQSFNDTCNPEKLYELPVVTYRYNDGYTDNEPHGEKLHIGFIAEDVNEVFSVACDYDSDGLPENWNSMEILPGMLKLVQDQHTVQEDHEKRIAELEAEVAYWKGKFESGT